MITGGCFLRVAKPTVEFGDSSTCADTGLREFCTPYTVELYCVAIGVVDGK